VFSPVITLFYPDRSDRWQTQTVILFLKILNALVFGALGVTILQRFNRFGRVQTLFERSLRFERLPRPTRGAGGVVSSGELDGREFKLVLAPTGAGGAATLSMSMVTDAEGPMLLGRRMDQGGTDPAHGDGELARRAVVVASELLVLTRLHGAVRDAALSLISEGWSVELDLGMTRRFVARRDGLPDGLSGALSKIALLCAIGPVPDEPSGLLIHRFRTEPRTSIRVACLVFLVANAPTEESTRELLAEARSDKDEPVRRFVLHRVVEDGGELSPDEAVILMGSGRDDDRLAGLDALDAELPLPEAAVVSCLRAGGDDVAIRASKVLAARGGRPAVAHLEWASRRMDLLPETRRRLAVARSALFDQLGGATVAGGLALADEQPHQLSLADGAAGQVGLVKERSD
jgi:hypothetical protein